MDFEYGETELDYLAAAVNAINYYRRVNKLGFEVRRDRRYYIDFSGYFMEGAGYGDEYYEDVLYSVLSPFMSNQGSVDYSTGMVTESREFYKKKNFIAEDMLTFNKNPNDYFEVSGVYIHLEHPRILAYLDKHLDTVMEDLGPQIREITEYESGAFDDALVEGTAENFFKADKEGMYFYISTGLAYFTEYVSDMFLSLMTAMMKRMEEDNEQST